MMKVFLLYSHQDFDPDRELPFNTADLVQDLALTTLFEAMAQKDRFVLEVVRQVLLLGGDDINTIRYRQDILADVLKHPDVIRDIYAIPLEFAERKRRQWLWISSRHSSPSSILSSARQLLAASLDLLWKLRRIADAHATTFHSRGFRRFFSMIQQELDDEYMTTVERHLKALRFPSGVLLQARLGRGNEGTGYMLCRPNESEGPWVKRLLGRKVKSYSYSLHPRDDHGARVLGELRDRGLARVANAVAQAAEHVESFLRVLQRELAFYIGCLNLYEQLRALGEPVSFPDPLPADTRHLSCTGLYDISLALTRQSAVVDNDVRAEGISLVIITGPNQGGKTTFLRSVGLAQLMMQAGMFVPARSFSANVCTGLFTHFKRGEDKRMESGKFEEELIRISEIIDHLTPNALVLFNESFAATNEREGSEVARQLVKALLEKHIKIFFVTHLYEFARHFYEQDGAGVLFLRAERRPDGTRTFKLKVGEPLKTSYGVDVYKKVFATS